MQLWHVQLYNDDFNMREHVARVLMFVAELSAEEANDCMQSTNWGGSAVVGTWEREVAVHIGEGMTQAGLRAGLRRAEVKPGKVSVVEIEDGEALDDDDGAESGYIRASLANSGSEPGSAAQEAARLWGQRDQQRRQDRLRRQRPRFDQQTDEVDDS